ncbi:transposase [uncultured Succinivibrio sp.]|uniref:transposase n=1 Tax=uncultured Succinivibrio sp. TaxID=540749 RepID=UPI0025D02670|nr:transposase [uncultured Succinivibrio sp.]
MNNIQQISSNSKTFLSFTSVLSKECLNISKLLRQSGFSKHSGVDILTMFMVFVKSIFCGAYSLHDRYSLKDVETPDCSYYALMRFISNSKHNWSLLLLLVAKTAISIISSLNNKGHIYTLCVDDTVIERPRGKKIEGLSRTFNHVIGKTVKGYANLLITWTDGITNIPVASELMEYVLMDTWFYSDSLVASLKELSLDSICMIKKNLKFAFVGETERHNLKYILSTLRQRNHTSDIISSVVVQTESGQKVKLIFIRNRNNRREFITLLCSNIQLTAEKIVELYSRRWSIECCFKAAKQYLGLNSECFARDYDSICALNRISYIRFTVLEIIRRHEDDPRSHGQLFRDSCTAIRTISFIEALETLSVCFSSLIDALDKAGYIVKGKLQAAYKLAEEIIEKWYDSISEFLKNLLKPSNIPEFLNS